MCRARHIQVWCLFGLSGVRLTEEPRDGGEDHADGSLYPPSRGTCQPAWPLTQKTERGRPTPIETSPGQRVIGTGQWPNQGEQPFQESVTEPDRNSTRRRERGVSWAYPLTATACGHPPDARATARACVVTRPCRFCEVRVSARVRRHVPPSCQEPRGYILVRAPRSGTPLDVSRLSSSVRK